MLSMCMYVVCVSVIESAMYEQDAYGTCIMICMVYSYSDSQEPPIVHLLLLIQFKQRSAKHALVITLILSRESFGRA